MFPLYIEDIFMANYGKVLSHFKIQLITWHKIMLSWQDRPKLSKSFIFPKFLFLFQTLPISLPMKNVSIWQRMLTKFVWAYKCPPISFDILQRLPIEGGLGMLTYNIIMKLPN